MDEMRNYRKNIFQEIQDNIREWPESLMLKPILGITSDSSTSNDIFYFMQEPQVLHHKQIIKGINILRTTNADMIDLMKNV